MDAVPEHRVPPAEHFRPQNGLFQSNA